jgi:hypothetical protein
MSPILGIWTSAQQGVNAVGDYESIQTVTVGTPVSSITFNSIPATYTHLQIRAIGRSAYPAGYGLTTSMIINSDSGSNYSQHYLAGDGSSVASAGVANNTSLGILWVGGTSTTANAFSVCVTDILDYSNTNKNKTVRSLGGGDMNGDGGIQLWSGNWRNTSAITSITISNAGNWVQYSSFALYGIK